MKKIRAAVVGYGNIGQYSLQALEAAPDFEVAGVVRRQGAKDKPLELQNYDVVSNITEPRRADACVQSARQSERYFGRMGPRVRLYRSHVDAEFGPQGLIVYQLWAGHEHGT